MVGPPPPSWAVEPERARSDEILPGLWRLRLPLPWEGIPHVNAFALARSDGGVTLVDCGGAGDPSCWDALLEALQGAGWGAGDVREVVLTHYHSDHAGPAARLADESGCTVLGHPDHAHFTEAMLRPGRIAAARERRARQEGVPEEHLAGYRTVREEIEGVTCPVMPEPLLEGAVIDSALGPWEVIETPGHAPSHLCLHQPGSGVLIAGDLLAPAFHPYMDYGYTQDPVGEYLASLERVGRMAGVTTVLPGHGRPLHDLGAAIDMWRDGLQQHTEDVAAAVAQGAASGYEVTRQVCGSEAGTIAAVWDLAEIVCYLRHLRIGGRIAREHGPGGEFHYRPTTAVGAVGQALSDR